MDGVARLCPAARGGPLERDKADRTITCLDTQGRCHSGDTAPKKWGWRAKGCRCTRSRVPTLAQSSGEGAAHADPGGVTSAPGAGTCDPERSPKDRQLSHPAQAMGKDPSPHPIPPSCESVGTAGDSVPGRDKSLSVAPAGTNGHSSSAGPAGTEGQGGSPGQPSREKDLIQRLGDLHPTAFMGQEDWIKNTGYTATESVGMTVAQ